MDRGFEEWMVDRWGPTAPESRVLLDGPKGPSTEVFRLAVLESIARGRLVAPKGSDLPGAKMRADLLVQGPETQRTGHRPLDAVLESFEEARAETSRAETLGVQLGEVVRATRKRYGSLDGYVKTEVLPALERRGLYERREKRLFWLVPVTRWELTRTGEAARAQLEQNREMGEKHFGEWVRRDPARAHQFLGLAGSSLLLMDALHPELGHLEDLEEDYDGGVVVPPVAPGPAGDLDALPDLEGALSALDSWSDGAWDDGGSSIGGWFDGGSGGGFDGGGGGGFDGGGGGF